MSHQNMKLGREDYKKKKELDELRKLGAAPAEVDADGYIINPHIPQYMAEAPWYLSTGDPGLHHQRLLHKKDTFIPIDIHIPKGEIKTSSPRIKKWKPGSCTNCGASTHKKRDCTERPRKVGAKYSKINIAKDEYLPSEKIDSLLHSWDGKRDRWNNYNIANHQLIIERHEKIEKEKRKKKARELDKALLETNVVNNEEDELKKKKIDKYRKKRAKLNNDDNPDSNKIDSDSDSDSDSDDSDLDSDDDMKDKGQIIQRFDSKKRQTVRNLRIREDLPKYLRNLDTDSAFYDPKTRSMRSNPYAGTDKEGTELYRGDNYIRDTGKALEFKDENRFAGLSVKMNGEILAGTVHLEANPTLTEKAFKEHQKKKNDIKSKFTKKVIDIYGGEEHLKAPFGDESDKILYGPTENYIEYDQHGQIVNARERFIEKSKYVEDEYPGNHTSVWGSWYDIKNDKWGFKCCKSVIYHSYCIGGDDNGTVNGDVQKNLLKNNNVLDGNQAHGVTMKPKDMVNNDRLIHPSGYVSTRGIMAKPNNRNNLNNNGNKKKKKKKIKRNIEQDNEGFKVPVPKKIKV